MHQYRSHNAYDDWYKSQALIDLAKKLKKKVKNLNQIKKIDIYTSHHTHYVIGTGANDPQKMDPNASRETLDHSIMYIFAVALEDGTWHHVKSYTKARAKRKSTIKIWRSIKTHEDKKWTKRYHDPNPRKKAFGAKVVITLKNGKKVAEEQGVADAHPYGARPFKRKNYINKFLTLTKNILSKKECDRFLKTVQNLKKLKSGELYKLNIEVKKSQISILDDGLRSKIRSKIKIFFKSAKRPYQKRAELSLKDISDIWKKESENGAVIFTINRESDLVQKFNKGDLSAKDFLRLLEGTLPIDSLMYYLNNDKLDKQKDSKLKKNAIEIMLANGLLTQQQYKRLTRKYG